MFAFFFRKVSFVRTPPKNPLGLLGVFYRRIFLIVLGSIDNLKMRYYNLKAVLRYNRLVVFFAFAVIVFINHGSKIYLEKIWHLKQFFLIWTEPCSP